MNKAKCIRLNFEEKLRLIRYFYKARLKSINPTADKMEYLTNYIFNTQHFSYGNVGVSFRTSDSTVTCIPLEKLEKIIKEKKYEMRKPKSTE